MTNASSTDGHDRRDHHVVLAPRATDAIGQTLRGAFGGEITSSTEFSRLLAQLTTVLPTSH